MANRLLQFFHYSHLPENLQAVSMPFYDLACKLDVLLPENSEKSAGLRKLLEAKDCAVRAAIYKDEKAAPQTAAA